jgi:hypothetical protein
MIGIQPIQYCYHQTQSSSNAVFEKNLVIILEQEQQFGCRAATSTLHGATLVAVPLVVSSVQHVVVAYQQHSEFKHQLTADTQFPAMILPVRRRCCLTTILHYRRRGYRDRQQKTFARATCRRRSTRYQLRWRTSSRNAIHWNTAMLAGG